MAVLKALIRSPYLEQPANFNEGNKWMHYIKPLLNVNLDGSFTIWLASFLFFIRLKQVVEKFFNSCCFLRYLAGIIVNYTAVLFTFVLIFRRISKGVYKFSDLGVAFIQNIQTLTIMLFTGG